MTSCFSPASFSSRLGLAAALLCAAPALAAPPLKPASQSAPRYAVTDLGLLPSVAADVELQINDGGQVSGWTDSGRQVIHAVLWTGGKPRDLGVPNGFRSSMARGLNNRGQVAGWAGASRTLVDSAMMTHACLWTGGKITDLGTLGGRDSQALAINDAGQVVGVSGRADGTRHAFLFAKGRMTDLGTLPGGRFSMAYAVNGKGEVAGVAEAAGHAIHGFLWKQGRMTDLGVLPGGRSSLAYAVNASGVAVGSALAGEEYHAVRFIEGRRQDLGTLGEDPAAAFSINDRGQIVGASNLSTIVRHAFLWEKGQMSDLNILIPAGGGWTLVSATGINQSGQIVCVARRKSGPPHAVRLTLLSH